MSDDISRLIADLGEVPQGVGKFARKALSGTALGVKKSWRVSLAGSPSVPAGPNTITYDITGGEGIRGDEIHAEIGPELGRPQASIVGILETGDASNVAPQGFGLKALADNEGDFVRGLEAAVDDALREVGL